MSQPLSPAAQAIWDAYETADCDPYEIDPRQAGLAAALRAAADQVERKWRGFAHEACQELRAIAAELEADRG